MQHLRTRCRRKVRWRWLLGGVVWLLLVWMQGLQAAPTVSSDFPLPKVLEPNVAFWITVFTDLDTRSGVLHDPDNLRIIYHTFSGLPERASERAEMIEQYQQYYVRILETLARGKRQNLSHDEQRVLALFPGQSTAKTFREAANEIRFQGGIRDRFAAGMARASVLLPEIERTFAAQGLPKALSLLPHVESSFQNTAYSRHGAAGIWQFMPGTGRRFLTINDTVDERLNVRLATIAAAKLLQENYRLLGTWPLAITAYNHGANGMRQAVEAVGTTDLGVIVQRYQGPSFGFASRNFYAEFLAAVTVATQPHLYFNTMAFHTPRSPVASTPPRMVQAAPRSQRYRVQRGDTLTSIAARFDTTVATLMALNRLERAHLVKLGQTLLVPATTAQHQAQPQTVVQRPITPKPAPAAQRRYQIQRGDTLASIAARFDTTVATLMALNRLRQPHLIKLGQTLIVPVAAASTPVPPRPVARQRYRVQRGDTLTAIAARFHTTVPILVALNGLRPPYVIQPGQSLTLAEPAPERQYQVQHGDTLSAIAERFDTTVSDLALRNALRRPYVIQPGQTLTLPPASPQAGLPERLSDGRLSLATMACPRYSQAA